MTTAIVFLLFGPVLVAMGWACTQIARTWLEKELPPLASSLLAFSIVAIGAYYLTFRSAEFPDCAERDYYRGVCEVYEDEDPAPPPPAWRSGVGLGLLLVGAAIAAWKKFPPAE